MKKLLCIVGLIAVALAPIRASAAITWMGHTWNVTSGGMAGVAQGSPNNVSIDSNGYLHLKITNNAGTWTAAELFTADKLGFGTYQWQIDGAVDRLDKNVVVGLYPYGPAAGIGGDGTNEIDIEYARWGNSAWDNGNWTVYPSSGTTVGSNTYMFTLNGTYTTSTFIWSSTSIVFRSQEGFKAIGDTSNTINKWTYSPSNPTTNLPQQALPLGMNLWCFDNPPSDGKNVEIIIRSFTFVPPGGSGIKVELMVKKQGVRNFVINQGNRILKCASPSNGVESATIFDLSGKAVRFLSIPAGATEVRLNGLPKGAYLVKFSPISR